MLVIEPLAYPVAYGLIPQTWDQDGDMLDFHHSKHNRKEVRTRITRGKIRVIGVMKFEDEREKRR